MQKQRDKCARMPRRAGRGGNDRARIRPVELVEPLEPRQLLADVVGLTLINAQTDHPVPSFSFVNGCAINLGSIGRQLNIRADLDPAGGPASSVRFNLDGNPTYKIE